jgi:hypothetical protein
MEYKRLFVDGIKIENFSDTKSKSTRNDLLYISHISSIDIEWVMTSANIVDFPL